MFNNIPTFISTLLVTLVASLTAVGQSNHPGSGYQLWFSNMQVSANNQDECPSAICIREDSPTFTLIADELQKSLKAMFKRPVPLVTKQAAKGLWVGTSSDKSLAGFFNNKELDTLGPDGFIIREIARENFIAIIANTDIGALYGAYHYLRLLQTTAAPLTSINLTEKPSYQYRLLNHWDNLDGTVERGYAGYSIWQWDGLPEKVSPRYKQYARANASIGINGTVLNNVNADPQILTPEYLAKVSAIANELRPFGIRVFLAVNFSSPEVLGGLEGSDPLSKQVQDWWKNKVDEIYNFVPDFGGFLVKANSEGLPGPQDFGRSHADGANMLARTLDPHGGIVMWRAFVYKPSGEDRAKQAYNEFKPLDGAFHENVIIQVKNGPIDFQPREPFSPIFGSMKKTTLMPELQITQEYLGFSDHLVYLGPLFEEFLSADTYQQGTNTTVAKVTDGSIFHDPVTAIAGVANIGLDSNWCGHHFAQANWYVFGRLAWDHQLPARAIAIEWIRQTFTQHPEFLDAMVPVMMQSREATVNYMTPLGLHHLMGWDHHYGPEPWCDIPGARPDWLPSYYHNADSTGIGFDRSSSGSNAVAQYAEPLRSIFDNPALCPEEYLLWFHHLPWDYELINGHTLWDELCHRYSEGVSRVHHFQKTWDRMKGKMDAERHHDVQNKLVIQANEARWWRDACLLYFQTFSGREIPLDLPRPLHILEELKKLEFELKHHN